jgi:hypothetical protein
MIFMEKLTSFQHLLASNPSLVEGIDAEKLRKDIITEFKQKGGSYASRIIWAQKPNNDI